MDNVSTIQSSEIATTQKPAAAGNAEKGVLSSDFETFIRMLTAQMQNQDPLNPMESTDFATQLATFSGVEQQVLTNDLLSSLSGQMGAQNLAQLSGWVGLDARAVMPVQFDGSPVYLRAEGAQTAQAHQLVTRNARNEVVARQDIPGGPQDISWRGRDAFGGHLPSGAYTLNVESFSRGELVATTPAQVEGRIAEARTQDGRAILVFENGQEVESEDILALKRPQ